MKLLLHIDSLARGGSQQQLVNLAIGMAARSHEVTIVTYAPGNAHAQALQGAGVHFICTGKKHRFDLMPSVALMKHIRRIKPDCIVAFLRTPGIYAEIARLIAPRTPLVVSERAGLLEHGLRTSDKVGGFLHLLANRVNANSRAYLDALCKFVPLLKKRSSVIYNGVAPEYHEAGRAHTQQLHSVGSSAQAPAVKQRTIELLVVAARPCRDKGLFVLIEALAQIVASGRLDVRVNWVGPCDAAHPLVDADEIDVARKAIESAGIQAYWQWLGPATNLHKLYTRYDALLLPSLHEGTPNAMCEAMCCGLPVVVTNIADNPLLVEHGIHGFVCQAGSVSSLAAAIETFCNLSLQRRRELGKNAHVRAAQLFSMSGYLDSWEALMLEGQRGSE